MSNDPIREVWQRYQTRKLGPTQGCVSDLWSAIDAEMKRRSRVLCEEHGGTPIQGGLCEVCTAARGSEMSDEPTIEEQIAFIAGELEDWPLEPGEVPEGEDEDPHTRALIRYMRGMNTATLASLRRLAALERDVLPAFEALMADKNGKPDAPVYANEEGTDMYCCYCGNLDAGIEQAYHVSECVWSIAWQALIRRKEGK